MTSKIFEFQGTFKEYVGDELMAIFGAPVSQTDHPNRICSAALAMRDRLHVLSESWRNQGRPALWARIGVNTGPMVVGNLGSPYRFSYGVLGDHVNLASRLEGLNKVYGTDILIGENTAMAVMDDFHLREVDQVRVKGREQPVRIYELISDSRKPLSGNAETVLSHYAAGLDQYRLQNWSKAIEAFGEVLRLRPDDKPSRIMKKRCIALKSSPPGDEWDGVFRLLTK